jgi:hypothetical protein
MYLTHDELAILAMLHVQCRSTCKKCPREDILLCMCKKSELAPFKIKQYLKVYGGAYEY